MNIVYGGIANFFKSVIADNGGITSNGDSIYTNSFDVQSYDCDIAAFIANNADILFRLVMVDTKDNSLPMKYLEITRCYNTVFVILSMLFGYSKTTNIINYCMDLDTKYSDNALQVSKLISKFEEYKSQKKRVIYFVNINAFSMTKVSSGSGSGSGSDHVYTHATFPGHVFLIEQYVKGDVIHYRLYQSYIFNYTLKDYYEKTNFDISYTQIIDMLTQLTVFYNSGTVWSDTHREIWKNMTGIDTLKQYDSFNIEGMRFCSYVSTVNNICYHNVYDLINKYINIADSHVDKYNQLLNELFVEVYTNTTPEGRSHLVNYINELKNNEHYKEQMINTDNISDPVLIQTLNDNVKYYNNKKNYIDTTFRFLSDEFKIDSIYNKKGIPVDELRSMLKELLKQLELKKNKETVHN